jgi:hypothetical protein
VLPFDHGRRAAAAARVGTQLDRQAASQKSRWGRHVPIHTRLLGNLEKAEAADTELYFYARGYVTIHSTQSARQTLGRRLLDRNEYTSICCS